MNFSATKKDYADVSTLSDDDLICYCTKVDKKNIVDAIKNGANTLKSIKETTTACTGDECAIVNPNKRCCGKEIKQLLKLGENNDK